jgi:predicted PhzF superfamily epimerase YddE/YHI9
LAAEGLVADVLSIEQGTAMGRRSILRLRPKPNPILSGAGVIVLTGTMSI